MCIRDRDGTETSNYYCKEAARWADGSLKWLHLYFTANMQALEKQSFLLTGRSSRLNAEAAGKPAHGPAESHTKKPQGPILETGIRGQAANAAVLADVNRRTQVDTAQEKESILLESRDICVAASYGDDSFKFVSPEGELLSLIHI